MGSIVVSISAFQAEDPGSSPGPRIFRKMETKQNTEKQEKSKNFYEKNYKLLLVIPALLLILSLVYIFSFYYQTGDIIKKDVSLTGGTTLTLYSQVNVVELRTALEQNFSDFSLREISSLTTGRQEAVIIQVPEQYKDEITPFLESYLNLKLTEENSSTEFSGGSLSTAFYSQLRLAIILAFVFMAIVVFIIFRTLVPSFAVILSAFADIVMTLALVNLLGISLSTAGIVAFLMLIGYSVDTDIMLTTRFLKRREGSLNSRHLSAFKTGVTMTLTSIIAITVALLITMSFSEVLKQIFIILLIGLGFDLLNTWITNASILRAYVEHKEKKWQN